MPSHENVYYFLFSSFHLALVPQFRIFISLSRPQELKKKKAQDRDVMEIADVVQRPHGPARQVKKNGRRLFLVTSSPL